MPLIPNPVRFSVALAIAVTVIGSANADADFCSKGDACTEVSVYNTASVLVTSVKIEQHTTDGACEYADNTFSQDLNGWTMESFDVMLNMTCKYKIKYHTTSGCSGDKTTHLTPDNFESGKDAIELKGACGSLKTIKY